MSLTNYLADPRPYSAAKWTPKSDVLTVSRYDNDRLFLQTTRDSVDVYAYTRLTLPAGTYRFGAEISYPQVSYASNPLRFIRLNPMQEMLNATWTGVHGRYVTGANTLTEQTQVELRVMCGPQAHSQIWYRHLFLMTDDDYQTMRDEAIEWFCGDEYESGGGASS
ncbi:hypothetical protein PG2006B_1088 [Bifidobacterium animalis subsp. animalis]|uniref:hypothetical protein n=1 Tax=Bifidobacterium animalis TaxID=28025 RepID=UPI0010203532|nr:hypothetical protein [Bifidobacterium animalis]RYN13514.1 hypothetical protein PG2006B_1088 [Bifidobacterium animalis subsp. animalis]